MCRKQKRQVGDLTRSASGKVDSRFSQICNAAERPPISLFHRSRQLQRPGGAHRYVRRGKSCLDGVLAWLTAGVQPLDRAGGVHMLFSCRAWAAPHALTRALRREPLSKRPQPQQRFAEPFQEQPPISLPYLDRKPCGFQHGQRVPHPAGRSDRPIPGPSHSACGWLGGRRVLHEVWLAEG